MKKPKFYSLDSKRHGVGGVITTKPRRRAQDKRAKAESYFAVVFFPKIEGIGRARLSYHRVLSTLSGSAEAAKMKFMDGIARGEKWETYARAGHRVRRIKLSDLGDA